MSELDVAIATRDRALTLAQELARKVGALPIDNADKWATQYATGACLMAMAEAMSPKPEALAAQGRELLDSIRREMRWALPAVRFEAGMKKLSLGPAEAAPRREQDAGREAGEERGA